MQFQAHLLSSEDNVCLIEGSEKLMERSPSADKKLCRMETGGNSQADRFR